MNIDERGGFYVVPIHKGATVYALCMHRRLSSILAVSVSPTARSAVTSLSSVIYSTYQPVFMAVPMLRLLVCYCICVRIRRGRKIEWKMSQKARTHTSHAYQLLCLEKQTYLSIVFMYVILYNTCSISCNA